ncbi:MAG: hypothetical protein HYR85_19660 [Planctomycetes bacterium]|nr:hypothetical protein [Planctomycetota bacterium]MBI3844026.1 hypothetical protein [Planctomycetota bacterium]
MNRRIVCAYALLSAALAGSAAAQSSVRAYYAKGQTFVVWQEAAVNPLTYDIYRSTSSFTDVSQATLAGRLFKDEWQGERLDAISGPLRGPNPDATWQIPTNGVGGTYQLATNEGLFVYTPHAASTEYFAVVKHSNTAVTATNITASAVAMGYDPLTDPITCHVQFSGTSQEGYPYVVYGMWSDGRADVEDARPDFPVTANLAKNGAPQVFAVYEPTSGAGAGPYPAVFAMHGGEGNFFYFRPGLFPNIGLDITEGILIAPSDNIVFQVGPAAHSDVTGWLGYVSNFDPFFAGVPTDPPVGSIVTDYTVRRTHWLIDWILGPNSGYHVDPARVSMLGHSAGGRGTSILTRARPERFAATTMFTPALIPSPSPASPLQGSTAQNLETTLIGPGGTPLHLLDVLRWSQRISPTVRDLPPTRIYCGLLDPTVEWDADHVTEFHACNDTAYGFHLFWDDRDHGVADWNTDDPNLPGIDIGQWVSPVRTEKATAESLHRYRNDQSFPAFFDDDQDPNANGLQPDIGTGDPNQPPPYGTWCGYYDWDTTTIVDETEVWACTIFLTTTSATSIDNAPFATSTASVALRRTQQFQPAPGAMLAWALTEGNRIVQSGSTTADADGVVKVTGLEIAGDTTPRRLVVSSRPCDVIAGNVDTGAGGAGPAGVLLVNGAVGVDCGRVAVAPTDPFQLQIVEPPSRVGLGARYWVGAWLGTARRTTVRTLPAQLGQIAMPMRLTGGAPQPRYIANNIPGTNAQLGAENWPGPNTLQAPYTLLNLPTGTGHPGLRLYFQGIVRDDRAAGPHSYSVTNGIQVEVGP